MSEKISDQPDRYLKACKLRKLQSGLQIKNMTLSNVGRTILLNKIILSWYSMDKEMQLLCRVGS